MAKPAGVNPVLAGVGAFAAVLGGLAILKQTRTSPPVASPQRGIPMPDYQVPSWEPPTLEPAPIPGALDDQALDYETLASDEFTERVKLYLQAIGKPQAPALREVEFIRQDDRIVMAGGRFALQPSPLSALRAAFGPGQLTVGSGGELGWQFTANQRKVFVRAADQFWHVYATQSNAIAIPDAALADIESPTEAELEASSLQRCDAIGRRAALHGPAARLKLGMTAPQVLAGLADDAPSDQTEPSDVLNLEVVGDELIINLKGDTTLKAIAVTGGTPLTCWQPQVVIGGIGYIRAGRARWALQADSASLQQMEPLTGLVDTALRDIAAFERENRQLAVGVPDIDFDAEVHDDSLRLELVTFGASERQAVFHRLRAELGPGKLRATEAGVPQLTWQRRGGTVQYFDTDGIGVLVLTPTQTSKVEAP